MIFLKSGEVWKALGSIRAILLLTPHKQERGKKREIGSGGLRIQVLLFECCNFSPGLKSPLGGAHPLGLNAGPNFGPMAARGKPPPLLTQGEQPCKRQNLRMPFLTRRRITP